MSESCHVDDNTKVDPSLEQLYAQLFGDEDPDGSIDTQHLQDCQSLTQKCQPGIDQQSCTSHVPGLAHIKGLLPEQQQVSLYLALMHADQWLNQRDQLSGDAAEYTTECASFSSTPSAPQSAPCTTGLCKFALPAPVNPLSQNLRTVCTLQAHYLSCIAGEGWFDNPACNQAMVFQHLPPWAIDMAGLIPHHMLPTQVSKANEEVALVYHPHNVDT